MKYKGLTSTKANQLLQKHGANQISEPNKVNGLTLLLNQFKSPLIYVLLIAAAFSAILGEYTEAVFILLVVGINTSLGFFQEFKAENILVALNQRVSKKVKVNRDGKRKFIDASELVPGDIIYLEPGLRIPSDGILLEATELKVNESILTGESVPVTKTTEISKNEKHNTVYMGTSVIEGVGIAQITVTGNNTEFGKIAASLESKFNPPTPIKKELRRISKFITIVISIITLVIITVGILEGIDFQEIFLTAVALGVSTIPEGLIISLTVTLALGMNRIMARKSIVRNLPAAETLGSVEVLCIDKTGTLTLGKMQVVDTDFNNRDQAHNALAICNNDTNFIDQAILEYLKQNTNPGFISKLQESRSNFFPFSSAQKYTGAFDGKNLYVVGAPEKILEFSKKEKKDWEKEILTQAKQGNRMIAVAYKPLKKKNATREDIKDMTFLGLVFVKDPIRTSVSESLAAIQKAGVSIKVITGDLKETSLAVLNALNFKLSKQELISGQELEDIKSDKKLDKKVAQVKLFYRTSPDQKLRIVQSLQRQKKVVGMMGDGVNDSPAIKKAEIGISVDNATDVTKEVADLILLDSNFETIVEAIKEGRNIFLNLRKIMVYLFAGSLSETTIIFLALLFGLPLPLLPLQLLWINLLEDGLPSLALSFDKSDLNLLAMKPRPHDKSIFDRTVIAVIVLISGFIDLIYFILYKFMIDNNYDLDAARTIMFAGISLSSIIFLFSAKTVDSNIWKENIFNNKIVNLAVFSSLGILIISIYWQPLQGLLTTVALNNAELMIIGVLSVLHITFTEISKFIVHKISKQT